MQGSGMHPNTTTTVSAILKRLACTPACPSRLLLTHHKAVGHCRPHPLHRHRVAELISPHGQCQQPEVAGGGAVIEVEGVILVGDEHIRELGAPVLHSTDAQHVKHRVQACVLCAAAVVCLLCCTGCCTAVHVLNTIQTGDRHWMARCCCCMSASMVWLQLLVLSVAVTQLSTGCIALYPSIVVHSLG